MPHKVQAATEMDRGEVVIGMPLVAYHDAAKVLKPGEQPFYPVRQTIMPQ